MGDRNSHKRVDIFKILSHEVRRRIILFIGDNEFASFTQLSRIEPKPGKLYYHLKLMKDLITQTEENLYTLTDLGREIYNLLKKEVFPQPIETRFGLNLFRPQMLLIYNKLSADALAILSVLLIAILVYSSNIFGVAFIPFYMLESPISAILTLTFFVINQILLIVFVKEFTELSIKTYSMATFSYTLSLFLIMISFFIIEYTVEYSEQISTIIIFIFQVLSLLIYSSGLSVSLRTTFRKSVVLPLLLHYFSSSLIYLRLI